MDPILLPIIIVIVAFVILAALLNRYRRCPSDKILVIYGTTSKNLPSGIFTITTRSVFIFS